MLKSLVIRNFAIIDELKIGFSPDFTVLTGETGAGKSILIGAIQLLLGQRADKSLIRKDKESCEILGVFDFHSNLDLAEEINSFLENRGVTACEEGILIIKRVVKANVSRVFINSDSATLGVLTGLGVKLVDIHGPHDSQTLVLSSTQLDVLDNYLDTHKILKQYQILFRHYQEIDQKFAALEEESASQTELELLKFQLNEIQQAGLEEGEDKDLNQRHSLAANSRKILEISDRNLCRLEGENAVLDRCSEIMRDFYDLSRIDPKAGEQFIQSLEEIMEKLRDLGTDLTSYGHKVDIDQNEMIQIEERLALLQKLKRKYGKDIPAVLEVAKSLTSKLEFLSNFAQTRENFLQEKKKALSEMTKCAEELSRKRCAGASKLSREIAHKLKDLGFKDSSFKIERYKAPLGPTGIDGVTYHFSPNPGEGFKPLKHIASSGEISRVMLAIKTVLAKSDKTPTLIFDEIDANIGGTTAAKVGTSLRSLGKDHQVLCITHLPQVAAGAARHYVVDKSTANGRTNTTIKLLDKKDRAHEIARMLGGKESTSVALTHARELIERAETSD